MAPINRIKTEMVGQSFGPFVRDYTFRDLELFALGCGAGIDGKEDLQYVNEHDVRAPRVSVLPMFGAMLIVDSEVTRTIDYGYNYAGSLHSEVADANNSPGNPGAITAALQGQGRFTIVVP